MSKTIVVFGTTGEIGSRIAGGCVRAGYRVIGVSRGVNLRHMANLDGVQMIYGDKADERFIEGVIAALDYDVIIDSVPTIGDIQRYYKHLKKAENVFICSSTGTFVPLKSYPADEMHSWREKTPLNFWDQSVRDNYALELWREDGFPVTIFRPTNIIGAGRVPLELWGGRDILFFKKLKNGEPLFIPPCENVLIQSGHNSDLASAFVGAIEHSDKVKGEIFIVSCKRAITLGQYLKVAVDYFNSRSDIKTVGTSELMEIYPSIRWEYGLEFLMEHMCFDIGKAESTIGYNPAKTAQEGLIESLEWCESSGAL